jgi:pimeloyl-ACP methyl ester carboxylesterase
MKHHEITGGGAVRLHVVDTGNPDGRPILFVHGFSQCWLAWARQLSSDLIGDHRLVALDLRGHGLSDKPQDAYSDTQAWADDLHAVIQTLGLDGPVLCGWSYGSLVALDYVRHYGEDGIGGLHFVDALTCLGNEKAMAVLTPELLALVPGLFAANVEESVAALEPFLRMCFAREPSAEELYLMLGYNLSVAPHVRQALFSRSIDNDDVLATLCKPVLVTHGGRDALVRTAIVDQIAESVPHAEVHLMEEAGHAAFWEDAPEFNARLRRFAESLSAA